MRVFVVAAFSLALFVCQTAVAGEFPLSTKGYQATITKITGQNTDHAIALGQVMRPNAEEYCNRDPGGITKQYGGQLTIAQCIEGILKYEKDKKVSATADCPRKKVTAEWGGGYVIVSKVFDGSCWKYTWKDELTNDVLDGSGASGALVIEQTFRMLCPAFIK